MPLRPTTPRTYLLALTLAAALLASGCTTEPPVPVATTTPKAPPIFATEDEALAAAEEFYAEYSEVSNEILRDGGSDPDRIVRFLHPDLLREVLDGYEGYRDKRQRMEGSIGFDSLRIQKVMDDREGPAVIRAYMCGDVTAARLVDQRDVDVTPKERPDRVPLEIEFKTVDRTSELLLSSSEAWEGEDFCIAK